jgi:hypothetical protein
MQPVMFGLDAFSLSHTAERLDIMPQEDADEFLPRLDPSMLPVLMDTRSPATYGNLTGPDAMMEVRSAIRDAFERSKRVIEEAAGAFGRASGRRQAGLVEDYRCGDAVGGDCGRRGVERGRQGRGGCAQGPGDEGGRPAYEGCAPLPVRGDIEGGGRREGGRGRGQGLLLRDGGHPGDGGRVGGRGQGGAVCRGARRQGHQARGLHGDGGGCAQGRGVGGPSPGARGVVGAEARRARGQGGA